ncbi:hypothetical protein BD414DRAFT_42683 [Trametes punicea]|nr:hypothetical protein BD414DRAFT_42683 [Trametes punicea]
MCLTKSPRRPMALLWPCLRLPLRSSGATCATSRVAIHRRYDPLPVKPRAAAILAAPYDIESTCPYCFWTPYFSQMERLANLGARSVACLAAGRTLFSLKCTADGGTRGRCTRQRWTVHASSASRATSTASCGLESQTRDVTTGARTSTLVWRAICSPHRSVPGPNLREVVMDASLLGLNM